MSCENDKQACSCGGECDCNEVKEVIQEEQPVMIEDAESSQISCGCGGGWMPMPGSSFAS